MKNEITNKQYYLLLFPYKKSQYDKLEYYLADITKLRHQNLYNKPKQYVFFGKETLKKDYEEYSYVKLENLQKVLFKGEKDFNKIIKQISKENLEI